jgi:hypothetical protein
MADQVLLTDRPPLLDLATLITRPVVRIDGALYELRSPDEVSVLEYARLTALGAKADALEMLEDPTEAQEAEYARLMDTICRKVLLAPDEVHAKLTSDQRGAVALTFTRLRLMASLGTAGATDEATKTETPTEAGAEPTTGAS